MLRLMGGILLLLGCVGYSRAFCRERRQKILRLHEIKKMYELLYSQIGCFMAAFPEACRAVSGRMEGNLADMLYAVWTETEKNDGRTGYEKLTMSFGIMGGLLLLIVLI